MEFYNVITKTINKGHCVGRTYGTALLEEEPKNKIEKVSWENLEEQYAKYGINLSFNVWNLKKGRAVSFFIDKMTPFFLKEWEKDIKEWKEPLDITIEIVYEKKTYMTIEKVLKWHDIEKAVQYLKERGLTVCPYESK